MLKALFPALMVVSLVAGLIPCRTFAKTDSNEYVRTANYFLLSGPKLDNNLDQLSKFDLLIIPVEAQIYNQSFFTSVREKNPDIILLAYMPTISWNDIYWSDPLHQKMYKSIQSDWWLKDKNGVQISIWPNTRALDLNTGWKDFLAQFVDDEVMSTGYWDGIFYDEVQDSSSAENFKNLFQTTREKLGNDVVIVINGSSNPIFTQYINGRMFETFPSSESSLPNWENMTNQYFVQDKANGDQSIQIINVNSENTGVQNDYQKIRFGLTTTLLGNGYFSYDFGTQNHAQTWSYDEYGVYLGAPKTIPQNIFNPQQAEIDTGVWQRDFANGKIIVNATEQIYTIELNGDFEKLRGTQDPAINNGSIISEVTVKPKDGIMLLRPIEEITDAVFLNGSFARVFSLDGKQKRAGFFAYDGSLRGGEKIIKFDINGDGEREIVAADETYVYIYNSDSSLSAKFAPYTKTYNKGINITVGDLENDGSVEIITGTENGGGPHVRVFNKDGKLISPGFFAYAKNFRGGVRVAVGDIDGDGKSEIITGAGFNGGPHVRVFNKDGKLINPGFFAYDKSFRGGVNVAVADVDNDGIDDIVTGPGIGGSPLARVFDKDGNKKSEFYAFNAMEQSGLDITTSDVDGDGLAEIIGQTMNVFTLSGYKSTAFDPSTSSGPAGGQ